MNSYKPHHKFKLEQNSPPPFPFPEKKNSTALYAIVGLSTLCVILTLLLVMSYSRPETYKSENPVSPVISPAVNTSSSYHSNSDSIALVALRDSLHTAAASGIVGGKLFAAVSLDKMNVFYIGVDNPVSISVAGFLPADLSPTVSGGTISKGSGQGRFIVRVNGGTAATLNVNANVNGVAQQVASYQFRIKRVPDPVAYIGNVKGDGQMTKAELQSQSGVFSRMENFDFDLKFTVVSFVMAMNIDGVYIEKKANGPALTPDMKMLLAKIKPGNRALFEQVTVQGPDGTLRKIPGVIIRVK
jgi:hypothetical protein